MEYAKGVLPSYKAYELKQRLAQQEMPNSEENGFTITCTAQSGYNEVIDMKLVFYVL